MAVKKARLSQKKATWQQQFKKPELKGTTLRPSAGIQAQFENEVYALVEEMTSETTRELKKLFRSPAAEALDSLEVKILREEGIISGYGMDESIASQSRILVNSLISRFFKLFNDRAETIAKRMVSRTIKNSSVTLRASLKKATGQAIKTDFMTGTLNEVTKASVSEAVGLIKRIPQEYLGKVQNAVMRSITTTEGSGSLIDELDKYNVQIKNWSRNVARDQTNKAYSNINRERMKAVGVKKFEWVHSGGSTHPRKLHKDVLNGNVYSIDAPPIIQEGKTPVRGLPGQLPYCNCKMRPVLEFDEVDDAA